jgi:geranylgeranyl diphosphate/geranylgeranyl-bacteriochlorophyllide a reductase
VKVAVVGGGPAGALLGWALARGGIAAAVFDASHPREKPCGGGLTRRAVALLPPEPAGDPLPVRWVDACRFEAPPDAVEVRLAQPIAVGSRLEIDAWLLRRATEAGAGHVAERVVGVDGSGTLRTAAGREMRFDVIVGADGAGSLVRRTFLGALPPARLMMAAGWFAPGEAPMLVRFTRGLAGYLWLFPRPDHVGVGICAPLAAVPTRELIARLEAEVARSFPALVEVEGGRYAHTIPSPTADPRSLLEIAGERWALVGDAAALADPITGEGIAYALRSAALLARVLIEDGSPRRYPERLLAEFGGELLKAAAIHDRFYAPGFADRTVRFAARSRAIRDVLADLVLGDQGYVGLKRRLLRAAPRFAWDAAVSRLFPAA